jgi:hypothetical protein
VFEIEVPLKKKEKKRRKKGEFRAGLYPPGIESRNTIPHAINGLVEVKKASFPPSSTTTITQIHFETGGGGANRFHGPYSQYPL